MSANGALHVIALCGGKDSTALALRLRERHPTHEFVYLTTPTGDELPALLEHLDRLAALLEAELTTVRAGPTLANLIQFMEGPPSLRHRWCARMLKINPSVAWLIRTANETGREPILYVALRADEHKPLSLYSQRLRTEFPLREWGWGAEHVSGYLRARGVTVPDRTDCARCYGQCASEWHALWRDHPHIYADAEAQEQRYGATFRTSDADGWPVSLRELRERFEAGEQPTVTARPAGRLLVCRL